MELRWDPILKEWIIVSGVRKKRPVYPEGFCPFCPGSEEVPLSGWKVLSIPNKYPSLMLNPPPPDVKKDSLYRSRKAEGFCEIVVYTPEHKTSLAQLDEAHIGLLIDLWTTRYRDLGCKEGVKYVFIFENKGREVGVTLDHPHGQIYAFPFIPPRIRQELASSREYWKRRGLCLFCRVIEMERDERNRVVAENRDFICFLPFYARWPYGVHIYPKRHVQSLLGLSDGEKKSFAELLKEVLNRFNKLFNNDFPYMMVLHQEPTDGKGYPYYHFHVEFYPPYREKGKLKFFASVETGTGTVTFDYRPEDKAYELCG